MVPRGLADLIDSCEVAAVIADTGLHGTPLVVANHAFSRMTGYPVSQIVGRNCRFMQTGDAAATARKRIHNFVHDDPAMQDQFIVPYTRRDGTPYLNLLHLVKMIHPDHPMLVLGIQFDITSQSISELKRSSATMRYHMRLIEKLMLAEGWSLEPATIDIEDSLERVALCAS